MEDSRRIDKIFLLHIWACVPFAPLWLLYSESRPEAGLVLGTRIVAAVCALYLVVRTWAVIRGAAPADWSLLWPIVDVLLVSAILVSLGDAEDPTNYLYLLAIAYATLKLPLRHSLLIVVLAIVCQFAAGEITGTWTRYFVAGNYMYVLFRHFFLLLLASLILFLSREMQRWRERLALTEYQRDLSAEMHDGIQHDLVLIARRLDLAAAVAGQDPARAANIAVEQRDVARRASEELRFLVRQLRPGSTDGRNYMDLLKAHLDHLAERCEVPVDLECQGDCDHIPASYQHAILRIVQEAVTNAVKHAGPRHIHVRVARGPARYKVTVEDDGQGFDVKEPSASGAGYGLESMRGRAETLGGRCRILSRPGRGTRVVVRLPAEPAERKGLFRGAHPRTVGGR